MRAHVTDVDNVNCFVKCLTSLIASLKRDYNGRGWNGQDMKITTIRGSGAPVWKFRAAQKLLAMPNNMSQQELAANVQTLNHQVTALSQTLSAALDDAMTKIDQLREKSDGAWARIDERINGQYVKITYFMDNVENTGGSDMPMELIDDRAIGPAVYG